MTTSRRDFLKKGLVLSAGCCVSGTLISLPGCTVPRYVDFTANSSQIEVSKSVFEEDKFVLLNHAPIKAPIYLKRVEPNSYRAFLMLCTHKACDVKPAGAILICPCHGSEFSSNGKVLKGPASEDLYEFPVKQNDEKIYVQLN